MPTAVVETLSFCPVFGSFDCSSSSVRADFETCGNAADESVDPPSFVLLQA